MVWLTAVALAGTREGVEALAREGSDIVLACDSVEQVTGALRRFSDRLGDERQEMLDTIEQFSSALAPDQPFTFGMWKESGGSFESAEFYAELSFHTSLDAMGVASVLGAGDEIRQVGDAVEIGDKWVVRVVDGVALVHDPGERPKRPAIDGAAARALPGDPGCAVLMELPGEGEFPGGTFAFHVPFERGQSMRFALRPNGDPLARVPRASAPPAVRTVRPPQALLWLGISLATLEVPADMDAKEARGLRKLQKYLPMDGLAIGLFPSQGLFAGPLPTIAVDMPLATDWSAEKTAKRMTRIIGKVSDKDMRLDIERTSSTSFVVRPRSGPLEFHVQATEDGLRLASTADLLDDLLTPGGQPWLDAARQDDLVYLRLDPALIPMLQAPEGAELSLGLGISGTLIVGDIAVRGDPDALADWGERIQQLAKAFGGGETK